MLYYPQVGLSMSTIPTTNWKTTHLVMISQIVNQTVKYTIYSWPTQSGDLKIITEWIWYHTGLVLEGLRLISLPRSICFLITYISLMVTEKNLHQRQPYTYHHKYIVYGLKQKWVYNLDICSCLQGMWQLNCDVFRKGLDRVKYPVDLIYNDNVIVIMW